MCLLTDGKKIRSKNKNNLRMLNKVPINKKKKPFSKRYIRENKIKKL